MHILFWFFGLIALTVGALAARHIASDIQIIILCVTVIGGLLLCGVALILGRLNAPSRPNPHDALASRQSPRL
jgi:hypothetical protein